MEITAIKAISIEITVIEAVAMEERAVVMVR